MALDIGGGLGGGGAIHPAVAMAFGQRRQRPQMPSKAALLGGMQGMGPNAGGPPQMEQQLLMQQLLRMALQRKQPGGLDSLYEGGDIPAYGPMDAGGAPWGMPTQPAGAEGLLQLLGLRQQSHGLGRGLY